MRLPTTRKDRALKRKRLEVSLEDELDALRDFADLADYTEAVRKREAETKAAEPAADKGKGKGKATATVAARAAPDSDGEGNGDSADEDALAYYNAVKASQERRREAREQAVAESKARPATAAFSGDEDGNGASSADDGNDKRMATDAILKNRGLTVKRKKELRNPRVKRRKQYEKAQKKLKSTGVRVAAVPQSAYGGESTGIKRNLARSVPLK